MEVTREAEQNWLKKMEEKHIDRTHFYEECTPGFLNNEGDFKNKPTFIGSTYGGGPIEYQEILERWREEQAGADCELIYANITEKARRSA